MKKKIGNVVKKKDTLKSLSKPLGEDLHTKKMCSIDAKSKVQWVLANVCMGETIATRPKMFFMSFSASSHL